MEFKKKKKITSAAVLIYSFPDRFMAFFFFLILSFDSHLSGGLTVYMWQQSFVHAAPTTMERAGETTVPNETSLTFCLGLRT